MLKNKLNTLKTVILASAFTTATLLAGCVSDVASNFFESPTVSLTSITPKSTSGEQLAFDVGLKVYNPNAVPLPISTISSDIALNGLSLISASGTAENAIPANGSEDITLSASVGSSQIQQLVSSINSADVSYDLNGKVGISGTNVTLPVQQSGTVNAVDLATKLIRASLSQ